MCQVQGAIGAIEVFFIVSLSPFPVKSGRMDLYMGDRDWKWGAGALGVLQLLSYSSYRLLATATEATVSTYKRTGENHVPDGKKCPQEQESDAAKKVVMLLTRLGSFIEAIIPAAGSNLPSPMQHGSVSIFMLSQASRRRLS